MAYFYSSNDHENLNNDYYQHYQSHNYEYSEPRYVHSYDHTQYYNTAYQLSPTQPIVGYHYSAYNQPDFLVTKNANLHENGEYYDPVSTQFVVSYSTTNAEVADDLDFEEYNPEPFHGGFDISQTYGKALPPSDEICYPPSKIDQIVPSSLDGTYDYGSIPSPYGERDEIVEGGGRPKPANGGVASNVIQEEHARDSEVDEDDEDEEEIEKEEEDLDDAKPTNGVIVSQVIQEENTSESSSEDEKEEEDEEENLGNLNDDKAINGVDFGKEIRRQIPPGYGMEAVDLCEGLFGGYFPCLSKRNQGNYDQRGVNEQMNDYDYWQGTADYLFGNPNPYGGAMPERGSYGDPVYSYQRHYPQQSLSVVEYEGNSSLLHNSRYYYYGQTGEYQ